MTSATRSLFVAGCCAVSVLVFAPAASGHGSDPTLVPVLRTITPALPGEVVVQVRTGVSEQMVVANPTADELAVLDPDGTPFLRISRDGVLGNVAEPFFHETLNPPDVPARVPVGARDDAAARWVRLTDSASFGWFEPRLHPFAPGAEPAGDAVATWRVVMRYGAVPIEVGGALERREVTGTFTASAEPRSDDVAVSVAQGRVPALLLVAPPGRSIVVVGSDEVDFLRLDSTGAFANTASASFRSNLEFVERAAGGSGWIRVGEPGRVRWLDTRLQYGADRPPELVVRSARSAALARWEIPLRIDGAPSPLRGVVSWAPVGVIPSEPGGSRAPWLGIGAGVAFVAAIGAVAMLARRRRTG